MEMKCIRCLCIIVCSEMCAKSGSSISISGNIGIGTMESVQLYVICTGEKGQNLYYGINIGMLYRREYQCGVLIGVKDDNILHWTNLLYDDSIGHLYGLHKFLYLTVIQDKIGRTKKDKEFFETLFIKKVEKRGFFLTIIEDFINERLLWFRQVFDTFSSFFQSLHILSYYSQPVSSVSYISSEDT